MDLERLVHHEVERLRAEDLQDRALDRILLRCPPQRLLLPLEALPRGTTLPFFLFFASLRVVAPSREILSSLFPLPFFASLRVFAPSREAIPGCDSAEA